MSPLAALKRFFSSGVEGTAPMDDAFVQIDRDAWVKSLKLVERGRDQGELNLPKSASQNLDVVEREIISQIGNELNSAQINVRNQRQAYENRLSDLRLLHEVGTITAATKKAAGDFETLVIDWQNRLSNRRDAIRESYFDLQRFKAEHSLTRPVFEVPSKVVTFGSIATAGLAEVCGNAIFLRVNDDLGYLGGIVAAIMVAAVNIGVAVSCGYLVWPRTHLRSSMERSVAWFGITFWLVFVGGWNLLAAHYRDAKSRGFDDPQGAAMQLLGRQTFSLDGIYSWGLLIVGVIAAIFAARSAYRMDDPFPGYGERARQHKQRCEEYAEEVAEANRALTGVRDDAIGDAEDIKRQLGIQFRESDRIKSAFASFAARFAQHQDRLEETANYLLGAYRDANRKARTLPEPSYFDQQYKLARTDVAQLPAEPLTSKDMASTEHLLSHCVDEVDAAFREAIRKFEPLDKLRAELESGAI